MTPLFVLGLVEFVRGALVFSLIPLYGQFVGGYSLGVIGTAISLHYLLDNVFRLPAGWLTDRIGGKWLMAAGVVVSASGVYMLYAHWNVTLFMVGAALFGLGTAPVWPTVIAGVAAKMPLHQLGEALSKVFIAWLVGAGLGPVIINFIIGRSYGLAFFLLLGVLALALLLTVFGRLPRAHIKDGVSLKDFFKELLGEVVELKILYPGMFVQTMSIGILMPVIAIYAETVFGFKPEQFSYLLIGGGAFTVLLLLPAGKFADRMGVKGPLIGGFLVASLCLVLLPLQRILWHAAVVGACLGIAYSFILPAWNGLQARVVSPEKRGSMWAFFMAVEGVGTATGAYVGGKVSELFGRQAPFWTSALVLAAMAVFYAMGNIDKLIKNR